jgi:hypothetical protein
LVAKNYGVRWVEAHQIVEIGYAVPKAGKVLLKYVGHPVPARSHIEGETFSLKHTRPATCALVFLQYRDLIAALG